MKGDTVVRTSDGTKLKVAEVVQAGGENLYRMESGEEVSEASFVREHTEARAAFETVRDR